MHLAVSSEIFIKCPFIHRQSCLAACHPLTTSLTVSRRRRQASGCLVHANVLLIRMRTLQRPSPTYKIRFQRQSFTEIYIYVYIYIYMYDYIYIYIYIYSHVYIYTYIYSSTTLCEDCIYISKKKRSYHHAILLEVLHRHVHLYVYIFTYTFNHQFILSNLMVSLFTRLFV